MLPIRKSTDVRKEFSAFIDTVVHEKPVVLQRNRDYVAALSLRHLEELLKVYRFKMEYEREEDGSYSGSILGFDVVANAPSVDKLMVKLAEDLTEYAQEYEADFELYSRTPNRAPHFPFILRILIQPDLDHVVDLIDA